MGATPPPSEMTVVEMLWIGFGLIAQTVFAARFIVQWLASERAGRSVIPLAFWFLSLIGSAMLLVYAIYRRDPVFILGQAPNLVIYMRNLHLRYRERREGSEQA